MPLLHVDTVVDAIVDTLDSGLSRTIFLPGIFSLLAGLVSRSFMGKELSRLLTDYTARSP